MKITQERLIEIELAPREAFIAKAEAKVLADAYRGLGELVTAVWAVCCDPEGRVVIRGSDGDRAVLQEALAKWKGMTK